MQARTRTHTLPVIEQPQQVVCLWVVWARNIHPGWHQLPAKMDFNQYSTPPVGQREEGNKNSQERSAPVCTWSLPSPACTDPTERSFRWGANIQPERVGFDRVFDLSFSSALCVSSSHLSRLSPTWRPGAPPPPPPVSARAFLVLHNLMGRSDSGLTGFTLWCSQFICVVHEVAGLSGTSCLPIKCLSRSSTFKCHSSHMNERKGAKMKLGKKKYMKKK